MRYDPGSLPEQISLVHGPHEVLARYFQIAEKALVERGVRLRFRADFERLVEINYEHRDSWAAFIPIFDPAHNRLCLDAPSGSKRSTSADAPSPPMPDTSTIGRIRTSSRS
jgi:hypothetical protein